MSESEKKPDLDVTQVKVKMDPKKVEKFKFDFDRKTRKWQFHYEGWNGKEYDVLFALKEDFLNRSPNMIEKDTKWMAHIAIYDYNEKNEDKIITTLLLNVPNMWPHEDPHKILDPKDQEDLIRVIMRDAHGEFLHRLAHGWMNWTAETFHALEFNVNFTTSAEGDKK